MKTISAYRSEDGTIHETRQDAAVADLIHLIGIPKDYAALIVENSDDIIELLRCLSGASYIRAYLPPPEAA